MFKDGAKRKNSVSHIGIVVEAEIMRNGRHTSDSSERINKITFDILSCKI